MRKLYQYISVFLLAVLCGGMMVLPVAATSTFMEYDGLEVTVEMDKESYDPGEPITATITVKNTSTQMLTIANLEQLIPQGYKLSAESQASARNIELLPGRTTVLAVTFEGTAEQNPADFENFGANLLNTILYGETWGIPNLLLVVLAVIAFAIFMFLT